MFVAILALLAGAHTPPTAPPPAPIRTYAIHADGGLVYDPLSVEAARTGELARASRAPGALRTIRLGDFTLRARLPARARAYEVAEIPYTLSWTGAPAFPVAVEGTAFEDPARRAGRDLMDLALPGRLTLDVRYLGSITAHMKPGARHNIRADLSDKPGVYPAYERRAMVKSGVVESGDIIWFRFRVRNTGNTILKPEGLGGWGLYPELQTRGADGKPKVYSHHYNLYIRDLKYLYPGESHDFWVNFTSAGSTESHRIDPGEYTIVFRAYHRNYRGWNDWMNMWDGAWMHIAEMPIRLEAKPRAAPVEPLRVTLTDSNQPDKITRYIHTFEEFMTSFDCHQAAPATGRTIRGALRVQVAPWTRQVVVKLIGTGPVRCRTAAAAVTIDLAPLAMRPKLHAGNCMVVGGRRVPVIYSQLMGDMRANIQVSPWPERTIREDTAQMLQCGVNVCATTAMPWLYADLGTPAENHTGDGMKYALDVARDMGMKLEAWGSYPFDRCMVADIYHGLTGEKVKLDVYDTNGYPAVSHADPHIAAANAAIWLYQFRRWGDAYAQFESGVIPFGTEDTRGWMRQDVDVRFPIGELSKRAFRQAMEAKYGSIDRLNRAWGSTFESFAAIDPERSATVNMFGHRWEYRSPGQPFHDWNAAMADYDAWRTDVRIRNYRESLALIRPTVPQAAMILRTEGANAIVAGLDPADPNPHLRHAFYSQRRVAAVADQIIPSRAFVLHSDYTTIPYTPAEIRRLTRSGVAQGVIPAWLPGFDNMRDIALNDRYGVDYQTNYNADRPVKGAMMHVLTPVYPWFKATLEEGGIPGVLWQDLQCDGFVTETQQREMRLFAAQLRAWQRTPAGKAASTRGVRKPDRSWLSRTTPRRSYMPPAAGR